MADEIKADLRTVLASPSSYRSQMGEAYFKETGDSITVVPALKEDKKDLTWRGAGGHVGKMFLELVEVPLANPWANGECRIIEAILTCCFRF